MFVIDCNIIKKRNRLDKSECKLLIELKFFKDFSSSIRHAPKTILIFK